MMKTRSMTSLVTSGTNGLTAGWQSAEPLASETYHSDTDRAGVRHVHMDTSASPSTRIRVPRNTSLHAFQWRPFTLIRVLYECCLPVNFTCTSSFCAGRVFIQPVWSEPHKICTNLIYTHHDAYLTS